MTQETERRREAYRNAASNLLAFGYEADEPASHRVQSPTSGAWHPCHCSRASDHVGALAAQRHAPRKSSLLERVTASKPPPEPPPYRGCALHSPCLPGAAAQWHVAPPGADWTDHAVDQFCEAHIDAGSPGEVPFGGWAETRENGGRR